MLSYLRSGEPTINGSNGTCYLKFVSLRIGNNFLVPLRTDNNLFGLERLVREGKDARESSCFCCIYLFALLVLLCSRFLGSESFFREPVPFLLFLLVLGINHLGVIYYCFLSSSGVMYSSVNRMIVSTE